jgi:hypothetical protein
MFSFYTALVLKVGQNKKTALPARHFYFLPAHSTFVAGKPQFLSV